jgi:VWFA-related protein
MFERRVRLVAVPLLACAAMTVTARQAVSPQPPQVPGAFRSRVTLVPVDVRVVDANGKPITDLKQTDFTVLENGIPQTIQHFEASTLVPEATPPEARPSLRSSAAGDARVAAQRQRIFLVVLGRGRLQDPASRVVDAAIRFVRERLLPQDMVAMLAYNRATSFSADHEAAAALLERYKRLHAAIEARLRSRMDGLASVYGDSAIPPSLQADIDAIFRGAPVRQAAPGSIADANRIAEDTRRAADALQRAEILADRPTDTVQADRTFDLAEAERIDLPFDEYVEKNLQTMQDVGSIYTGIEYMRYIDGEKHLVFITERGLFLPRLEDDLSLAARANDARVALDVIHTGGSPAPPPPPPTLNPQTPARLNPLPTTTALFNQTFQIQTSRTLAELTGGQASAMTTGDTAFARLDEATRSEYLIGYYPSDTPSDGRYRRIVVRVNRPGARVLYRHGYYARPQLVPFDRRQFLTYSRIVSAGGYDGQVTDLGVRVQAAMGQPGELLVDVTIAAPRVAFRTVDGLHVGGLDVAFFAGDARQRVIGEAWQKIDLKLKDETYQRFLREGASYTARVSVRGSPKYVKVVVYDYAADLVGTAVAKVP